MKEVKKFSEYNINLPKNFKILDPVKYFEKYYKGDIIMYSSMNFAGGDFHQKLESNIRYIIKKKNLNIAENKIYSLFSHIIHGANKNVLNNLFGKPKVTTRLGEGRASIWFVEIDNKIIMLFHDSRGVSIEIEGDEDFEKLRLQSDLLLKIMTNLFSYILDGCILYDKKIIGFFLEN